MRTGGRALVETTFSLDIRPLVRAGAIRDDVHADGKMKFGPLTTTTLSPSPSRYRPATARIVGCGCAAPSPIGGPASGATSTTKFPSPQSATRAVGGDGVLSAPPRGGGYVSSTCLPGRGISGPGRPTISPTKPSIWTTASGPGGACANAAGSSAATRMVSASPTLRSRRGCLPSRYAWLLDRLDAAEDDLGLPLTLGGPRFAYRPDRHRLRGRP